MRALALTLLLAACAQQRFNAVDVAGQVAFGAVLALDYSQTVKIVRDGGEHNPIIGRHGERVPPGIYFPAAFLLHMLVSVALPRGFRNAWQAGWVVAEGVTVWNNGAEGYLP